MLRASRDDPFACSARASSKRCGTSSVLACEDVGGAANASKPAKWGVPNRQPSTISLTLQNPGDFLGCNVRRIRLSLRCCFNGAIGIVYNRACKSPVENIGARYFRDEEENLFRFGRADCLTFCGHLLSVS